MTTKNKKILSVVIITFLSIPITVYFAILGVRYFSSASDNQTTPVQGLAYYAAAKGINIGTLFQECYGKNNLQKEKCLNVVKTEYKGMMLTFYNNWARLEPAQGQLNFGFIDEYITTAKTYGFTLHDVHLLGVGYGQYIPKWLFPSGINGTCDNRTPAELDAIIKNRIQGVIEHEAPSNTVVMWNVVNEAFNANGQLFDNCFSRLLPDYIDRAFKYAREATPNGILVLNEEFRPYTMPPRVDVDGFFAYVKAAKTRGVPIDAVGIQDHALSVNGAQFETAYLDSFNYMLAKAKDAGVKVAITEMDVYQANKTQEDVARVYKETLEACLEYSNCISFETWGISDAETWVKTYLKITDAQPLLFDEAYQKKPAYYGVLAALGAPSASLNFKFKIQGLNKKGHDKKITIYMRNGSINVYANDGITVTSDDSGNYSGNISYITPGSYDIYVKDNSSLQKKFASVVLTVGNNTKDWSETPLLIGDLNNDNKISIFDIAKILTQYTSLAAPVTDIDRIYDLNNDGIINIIDIALSLSNFTKLEVPGD